MSAFGKKRFQAMAPLAGSMSDVTLASPTISSATISSATITEATNLQVAATAKVTNISNPAGSDLADDVSTVNMVNADHGKIFLCLNTNKQKTIVLPGNSGTSRIGTQITILQNADLTALGALTMSAGPGNTFSLNSYAQVVAGAGGLPQAYQRPADANNTIIIEGAAVNASWTLGSTAVFTCVAANEWHFVLDGKAIGSGKADAITFSTV